jgi:hypothetical protein
LYGCYGCLPSTFSTQFRRAFFPSSEHEVRRKALKLLAASQNFSAISASKSTAQRSNHLMLMISVVLLPVTDAYMSSWPLSVIALTSICVLKSGH